MFPCCCTSSSSSSSAASGSSSSSDDCVTTLQLTYCGTISDPITERYRSNDTGYGGGGCGCVQRIGRKFRWQFEFAVAGVTGTCGDVNGLFEVFDGDCSTYQTFASTSYCTFYKYWIVPVGPSLELQLRAFSTPVARYTQGTFNRETGGTFDYFSNTYGANWPATITATPVTPTQSFLTARFGAPGDCIT